MAVARDSRKPGSTGAPADGCHFPRDVLPQVLHQMEAIGDLRGGWRAFPDALGIEPTTVTADDFGPRRHSPACDLSTPNLESVFCAIAHLFVRAVQR
jgi:hypothetical protein